MRSHLNSLSFRITIGYIYLFVNLTTDISPFPRIFSIDFPDFWSGFSPCESESKCHGKCAGAGAPQTCVLLYTNRKTGTSAENDEIGKSFFRFCRPLCREILPPEISCRSAPVFPHTMDWKAFVPSQTTERREVFVLDSINGINALGVAELTNWEMRRDEGSVFPAGGGTGTGQSPCGRIPFTRRTGCLYPQSGTAFLIIPFSEGKEDNGIGKPENKGERASARQTERQVNHGAEKSEKRSADPGSGDTAVL